MGTDAPTRPPRTGFWTREYWLDHCEGYRVSTRDEHVGFVEQIVRDPGTEKPAALAVRRCAGDPGLAVVPIALIAEVRPETEEIILAAGADAA